MMLEKTTFHNSVWKTPYLPVIPQSIHGMSPACVLVTDREKLEWEFLFEEIKKIPSPYSKHQDYNFDVIDASKWRPVVVPGSLSMQGFAIENNVEYYYRRKLTIPVHFVGNRVFLRFEGVYSNARVWVNHTFVKTHVGGFTVWDCDITPFANEKEITVVIGVTDVEGSHKGIWNPRGEMVSNAAWASYYAHHNIGGILRDVTLFALPEHYIARTHINTLVHRDGLSAAVQVDLELHSSCNSMRISAELLDENQTVCAALSEPIGDVYLQHETFDAPAFSKEPGKKWTEKNKKSYENDSKYSKLAVDDFQPVHQALEHYCMRFTLPVKQPKLWDAEHPNLYHLKITLLADREELQENIHQTGLRQLTYGGENATDKNKVYVNGNEIKLHGVCRHDVSHLYGRSLTNDDIYNEILVYKRNNINHIRTSHYPASDYLLQVCDRLGIYVEQGNAACFKGANGFGVYNPPREFQDAFAEMIESGRNHPSVIIWSLANESGFEKTFAFRMEYNYVKQCDTTRPVIFSYPDTVHSKPVPYDIFSRHYKKVTGNLGKKKMPVLHDEFAHVACYNTEQLLFDNSCREFWGESIKKGWDNLFCTDGALGCAIWAAIDDVFYLPDGISEKHQNHAPGKCAGYGEWGCMLDAYKREKPEAYLTKKAFTTVLLDEKRTVFGEQVEIFLTNRFDHALLSEVIMVCTDENGTIVFDGYIQEPIRPHASGMVRFPKGKSSVVRVQFYYLDFLVDEYVLSNRKKNVPLHSKKNSLGMAAVYDERTKAIGLTYNNTKIVQGLSLSLHPKEKTGNTLENVVQSGSGITATIKCSNQMKFALKIEPTDQGLFFDIAPKNTVALLARYADMHLCLRLADQVKAVSWHRKSSYSSYPEGHIARAIGTAQREREDAAKHPDQYGKKPAWGWKDDMVNYFLTNGKNEAHSMETNDFRTKRNNIYHYAVTFEHGYRLSVQALSKNLNAYVACKGDTGETADELQLSKGQYYPSLQWGNYFGHKNTMEKGNSIRFVLSLSGREEEE